MPANAKIILNLSRFLPYRLSTLSNTVSEIIAQTYKDKFALSVTEWRIIAVLGEAPGASADEVSVTTQIEKSIISRSLKKLLQRHFVIRDVDDADRRRHNLRLSDIGNDVYQQIVPELYQYEASVLDCFSTKEREQFDKLIDRLHAHTKTVLKQSLD